MKKIIFTLSFLLPGIIALCQNVKSAGVDQYSKQYSITTDKVDIYLTEFNQNVFSIELNSQDNTIILNLSGYIGHPLSIYKGDRLVFLLIEDSTVSAISPIDQSTYPSPPDWGAFGSTSPYGTSNVLKLVYLIDSNAVKKLMTYPVLGIRLYYNGGYSSLTTGITYDSPTKSLAILAKNFIAAYEAGKSKWLHSVSH